MSELDTRSVLLRRLDAARRHLEHCTDREFAIELVTQGLDVSRACGYLDGYIVGEAIKGLESPAPSPTLRGLDLLERDLTDFERMIVAPEEIGRHMRTIANRFQEAELLPDRRRH